MKKTTKPSPVASLKSKLVKLSVGTKRDFNLLSLEFAIERLIVRLQSSPKLSKHLLFKGGFVMLKAYGSNRATIDLDTSIHGISIEEAETLARKAIEADWDDGLWMGAIESQTLDHQTEYAGLRLIIRFSFGKPAVEFKRMGKLILDIGVADAVTPGPRDLSIKPLLGGSEISWRVYPAETIVAEKLHAVVTHGSLNSRLKDIYDLTILLPNCNDLPLLRSAIVACFKHRSTIPPESFAAFWQGLNKDVLRRSTGAVRPMNGEIPSFDDLEQNLTDLLKLLDKGNQK